MKHKMAAAVATIGAVAALQFTGAGTVFAHHPTIAATVICADSGSEPMIAYTSTAWEGWGGDPTNDPSRENAQIDIYVGGVLVGSGAYTAPNYSFSGTTPLPAGATVGSTVDVTAVAVADWVGSTATVTVTVPELDCLALANGRFTGGGNQVRIGAARVTRGLTIHCDLLLSNNLEVNWGGNKFHMTEHLTTVECSDDPAIIQAPPPAPLDTLIGVGTGRYNNVNGYTIEFTLRDFGEPGANDEAALKIYQASNPSNVVLEVPLSKLTGGNLQAHYDQPHK